MLALKRKTGETVRLRTRDGVILIEVARTGQTHVRLRIYAPRSVIIERPELDGRDKKLDVLPYYSD